MKNAGVQLREARRDTLGQFVNQLGKEFEELEAIFEPLLSAGSGQVPSNERVLRCLQFFGRVKTLSDIGVLDVKIIDAMFGYQFYLFVNDPQLQEQLLFNGEHYFPEVFALHHQLSAWRGKLGVEIPRTKTDLVFREWVGKDDILRHSYGTYRAAILRNSHNLAEEMGNSVSMVRTYYDAVVSPSVAKLWWKVRPARPKNVVPIKAAA